MNVYLIRHAIAADPQPGQADADRPLTAEGIERFRRAVRGMEHLGIQLNKIYYSPFRRAVQTTVILGPLQGQAVETPLLTLPPSPGLLDLLEDQCALVGHEPDLSALASWLLCGTRDFTAQFPFKKGGVLWLEGLPQPGQMQLRAALPPKVLRALGGLQLEKK